ncbi:MAG: MerR family transcriptional regulator, partial [Microbacteriaceae bacterium]
MNSSEIARLAGVSVRTLRHYHQVGVLPEPERSANGYRRYAVADLVLLLRIKRLGALGIPLDAMGPVLADAGAPEAAAMLDELDSELEKQMAQLAAQRDLIARIRADRSDLDLAPEFAAMRRASQAM